MGNDNSAVVCCPLENLLIGSLIESNFSHIKNIELWQVRSELNQQSAFYVFIRQEEHSCPPAHLRRSGRLSRHIVISSSDIKPSANAPSAISFALFSLSKR